MTPVSTLMLFAASTLAKTIDISVGTPEGGLAFSPDTSNASPGDTLLFHFYPYLYSVIRGTFENPCQPADAGFYSGEWHGADNGGENGTTFGVQVQDTEPIWFYCGVGGHCGAGMLGVVNPPDGGPNLVDWKAAARSCLSGTVKVPAGYGGTLGNINDRPDVPSSFDPLHPQTNNDGTNPVSSTNMLASIISSVVATTIDGNGRTVTTSYDTTVAAETTVTTTKAGTKNDTQTAVGKIGSLVPSFGAADVAMERPGTVGLAAILLGVVAGLT